MKKIYWLVCFTLFSFCASGQKLKTAKADGYFNQFRFEDAARAYEKLIGSDTTHMAIMEKLVQCYTRLNNQEKAAFWLRKVVNQPQPDPNHYRTLASMLAGNGRYEEAKHWFAKSVEANKHPESERWLKAYQNMPAFYEDSALYQVKKPAFNSGHSDFSPAFYEDGLVFCSARLNGTTNKDQYNTYNAWFIDLYYVNDTEAQPQVFGKRLNTTYHEGPATFNAKQDTLYFTRSNFLKKQSFSSDGVNKLKIYYAALNNGQMDQIQEFKWNNNEYSVGHPAMAPNGTLYFSSDMPGGYGGADLYKTEKVNGIWQKPVNLGPEINTSANELFPYVDQQGNLYFSSNGHPGLGGLDLFLASTKANHFGPVKNMGYPLNTTRDDFGLIMKDNTGYFSSNRNGDIGDDNIYQFRINRTKTLLLLVTDEKGKYIHEAKVKQSYTAGKEPITSTLSLSPQEWTLEYGETDALKFAKEGYRDYEWKLSKRDFFKWKHLDTLTIKLAKKVTAIDGKTVRMVLTDKKGKLLKGGRIEIKDMVTGETKSFIVKDNGTVSLKLASEKSFQLKGSMSGYQDAIVNLSESDVEQSHPNKPIRIELPDPELFASSKIGQMIELDIRYDVNKADIRPEAAEKLDQLVSFLKENPNLRLELGSHTDSRGSATLNEALSQKRAESVARYLISKGIEKDRLVAVGYGKNKLKVPNAKSEKEHHQNRRTTVKIIGE